MTVQAAIGVYLRSKIVQYVGPVRVPDGTAPPYVFYRCGALTPDKSLTGPDLRRSLTLHVICVSQSYDEAWSIAETIIKAMDYHTGPLYGSNSPVDSIDDVKILFDTADDEEAQIFGEFEVSLQFHVSYPV